MVSLPGCSHRTSPAAFAAATPMKEQPMSEGFYDDEIQKVPWDSEAWDDAKFEPMRSALERC